MNSADIICVRFVKISGKKEKQLGSNINNARDAKVANKPFQQQFICFQQL